MNQLSNSENTMNKNTWTKPEIKLLPIADATLGATAAVNDGGGLS
jgi:hypothetical protein